MKAQNIILLLLAAVLVASSLFIGSRHEGAEFAGTDGQAMEAISAANPDYEPWFGFFWEAPPEVASGLFALQAAFGAGVLGYYFGLRRGQLRRKDTDAGT